MVDTGNLIEAAVGGAIAIKLLESSERVINKKRKDRKPKEFKLPNMKI
jgi:hypothetical protein